MTVSRRALLPIEDGILTLPELFAWRVARTPQAVAYREFNRVAGAWINLSWQTIQVRKRRFDAALTASPAPRGSRIAILLPNSVEAVCVDQAVLSRACVPVPLHTLDNPASIAWILADSDAAVLFAASDAQWRAIESVGMPLPALALVVVLRKEVGGANSENGPRVVTLDEWLAAGRLLATSTAPVLPPTWSDLAAIVYTSGTTGRPKGVMLTHSNVLSNVFATMGRVEASESDVFLSFLPLSHTFERTVGYYLPIAAGCCVAFSRSVADLPEDLRMVEPTVLVSVPRIYERVHAGMRAAVASSRWRSALLDVAEAVGWQRYVATTGPRRSAFRRTLLDVVWPLFDRLVARRVRAQFGGRLRIAVSGGAAMSQSISRCFLGFGVPVVQGYGMTETSPVVATNTPEDNDPATVGRLLDGVEARIGDNRELLVRGPGVMRGYWKREAETAQAFIDGWLRTGDQAAIEGGRLRILGRVKEIIVTSTGEKIAPADLELAITGDPLFDQAWVLGEGRPFIACVVVLNVPQWTALARRLGLDPRAPESLASPAALAEAMRRIEGQTRTFPRHGQPRKVLLTLDGWTLENTLLTPTLKLKRLNLQARFGADLDKLYADRTRPQPSEATA